jgi:hypothetical protein
LVKRLSVLRIILSSMSSIYRRPHSAGWITPDGELIEIPDGMNHDDVAQDFPGVPRGEEYPASFATRELGYLRISNPFDFITPEPPRRGDPRLEAMAEFTANAVLSYGRYPPSWLNIPMRSRGTPLDWEVKISQPGLRWESTTVADFVDRFAPRETSERLFSYFLSRLQERLIRAMIKQLMREARRAS